MDLLQSTLKLDDWQKEFLETKGDKILCCGRQIGKSITCGHDAAAWAISHPKKVILMIAPTERQAYALFDKTLRYLIDFWPKNIKKGKHRPTKTKIQLTNGTIIWCLPTGISGIGIRFLTVHRLYVDEASRIPQEVWDAVTPMLLTTGGDSILLSTPFGTDNHYHEVWANKDNAYKSYTRFHYSSHEIISKRPICETWTEAQRVKALEHLESEQLRMSSLVYAQEYLGQPMHNLRQVFPDKLIQKCMKAQRRDRIYPNRRYYLGVDIARMGEDESTFEIIDRTDPKHLIHVENMITKKTLTTDSARHIIHLDKLYNFKQIFVDDGGMGVGVFDMLLDEEATRRKTVAINNMARPLDREEKQKKKIIKEDIYNNLVAIMERGEIFLLDDPEIFQSLKSVQFEIVNGKTKYFGNYTHIAEGLIRAAWCVKDKALNIYIY